MNYQILKRDAFQIVGVRKSISCNEQIDQSNDINRFWAQVGEEGIVDQLLTLNNGQISGLIGATVDFNAKNNQIDYWIAVESSGVAPTGLFIYEIPPAKWIIFEAIGPVAQIVPETWRKIYSEWLPTSNYQHSGGPSLEIYKSAHPTSPTAKTEIWIPVN